MNPALKALATLLITTFLICTLYLLTFPATALAGFVLTKLWGWFLVPLGAPTITFWHALGVLTTVGLLKIGLAVAQPKEDKGFWHEWEWRISVSMTASLLAWGLGAIFHHFM